MKYLADSMSFSITFFFSSNVAMRSFAMASSRSAEMLSCCNTFTSSLNRSMQSLFSCCRPRIHMMEWTSRCILAGNVTFISLLLLDMSSCCITPLSATSDSGRRGRSLFCNSIVCRPRNSN